MTPKRKEPNRAAPDDPAVALPLAPRAAADLCRRFRLGDTNGDGTPEFPVGRLPARTPQEVATMVRKIVAYERGAPDTTDLRLLGWAGARSTGRRSTKWRAG